MDISNGWLGTTRIAGPIRRVAEGDNGFNKLARGLYGQEPLELLKKPGYQSPLGVTMAQVNRMFAPEAAVDGPPAAERLPIPDPERMSMHVKDACCFVGATEVGIGLLPRFALCSHQQPSDDRLRAGERLGVSVENSHPFCVVMLFDQDFITTTMSSTGFDGGAFGARRGYMQGAIAASVIASDIRKLGYSARAHHNDNYQVAVPPTIVAAGLGEMCRAGECALHPRIGFRLKASVVTTDLPLIPDRPIDFGLKEFCSSCLKCAQNCPVHAISYDRDQSLHNGYYRWPLDVQKCTIFRRTNPDGYGCGRCMKACSWSSKEESWFHRLGSYVSSKSSVGGRLLKGVDDLFGYGTEISKDTKWWLGWPELHK